MTIPAFNNSPGYHEHYEYYSGTRIDRIGGNPPWVRPWNEGSYLMEACKRPAPEKGMKYGNWRYPTPWSRSVRKTKPGRMGVEPADRNAGNWTALEGPSCGFFPFEAPAPDSFDPHLGNARSKALTLSLSRTRGDRAIQMGASMGEMGQTLRMIGSSASKVAKAYMDVRRGKFYSALDHLGLAIPRSGVTLGKGPADFWLEYQYGWKPLMQDMYDGGNLIAQGLRNPNSIWLSCSGTGKYSGSEDLYRPGGVVGFRLKEKYSRDYYAHVKHFYTVSSQLADQIDGFGLFNPASIAWELVPFSFVVDWFVPVGNLLAAATSTIGLDYIAGYITEGQTDTREGILEPNTDGSNDGQTSFGSFYQQAYSMLRVPLSGFPSAELYANENPWSSAHIANATALVRQLF